MQPVQLDGGGLGCFQLPGRVGVGLDRVRDGGAVRQDLRPRDCELSQLFGSGQYVVNAGRSGLPTHGCRSGEHRVEVECEASGLHEGLPLVAGTQGPLDLTLSTQNLSKLLRHNDTEEVDAVAGAVNVGG